MITFADQEFESFEALCHELVYGEKCGGPGSRRPGPCPSAVKPEPKPDAAPKPMDVDPNSLRSSKQPGAGSYAPPEPTGTYQPAFAKLSPELQKTVQEAQQKMVDLVTGSYEKAGNVIGKQMLNAINKGNFGGIAWGATAPNDLQDLIDKNVKSLVSKTQSAASKIVADAKKQIQGILGTTGWKTPAVSDFLSDMKTFGKQASGEMQSTADVMLKHSKAWQYLANYADYGYTKEQGQSYAKQYAGMDLQRWGTHSLGRASKKLASKVSGVLYHVSTGKKSYDEPEITSTVYDLDYETCKLTINHYDAAILNTKNFLIADVDLTDGAKLGVKNADEVLALLGNLSALDQKLRQRQLGFTFANQSYRVYKTHSGFRVMMTSRPVSMANQGREIGEFLRFMNSDREYVEFCFEQKCFRTRLTCKPWRVSSLTDRAANLFLIYKKLGVPDVPSVDINDTEKPTHICEFVKAVGDDYIHPELAEQMRLHDDLTLPKKKESVMV